MALYWKTKKNKFKFVFEKPLTSPGYTVYIESVGMKL